MLYGLNSRVILLAVAVLVARAATAATLRVEADGSGDYTSLFEATSSAVAGDSILVGPGVYSQLHRVQLDQWTLDVVGLVTVSDIHIIGEDRESVFVGPPSRTGPFPNTLEYGLIAWFGAGNMQVSNITVQNLSKGFADTDLAASYYNCSIMGTEDGITQTGHGGTTVSNCRFEDNALGVIAYSVSGFREVRIEQCSFLGDDNAVQLQGVNGRVIDCEIQGGDAGIIVINGAQVLVQRSKIANTSRQGISVGVGCQLYLFDTSVSGVAEKGLEVLWGAVTGTGNRIAAGSLGNLWLVEPNEINFRLNHILNAGGLSVRGAAGITDPQTISLAENWWGTTNTDSIDAWIHDSADDPEWNAMTVEYLPIEAEPVSTQEGSVSPNSSKTKRAKRRLSITGGRLFA